jgi:hypothetical protein
MATVPIKWFDSSVMLGMPNTSTTVGSMIAILDCALINGFNLKSATSLSVSSGVATVDFGSSGHGYIKDQVVLISGVTSPTELNGEWVVTAALSTAITFSCVGIADGVATGAITCKCAPLGWIKLFSGTNKACYKSADADSTGGVLYVNDSTSLYAPEVRMYESMSDINTGVNKTPDSLEMPISTWHKANTNNPTVRQVLLVGDSKAIYLSINPGYANLSADPYSVIRVNSFFGDIISYKLQDKYHCMITSGSYDADNWYGLQYGNALHDNNPSSSSVFARVLRGFIQIGSYARVQSLGPYIHSGSYSSPCSFPNGPDNSLMVSDFKLVVDKDLRAIRGRMPGFYSLLQHVPVRTGEIINDSGINKKLIIVGSAQDSNPIYYYRFALDLTGPWR